MNLIKRWHEEGILLNYGREIIQEFILKQRFSVGNSLRILDIGCGGGDDLSTIKNRLKQERISVDCFGTDFDSENISTCQNQGIQTVSVDLEGERLPFETNYFDITICNQVMEHLKNWIWVLHEQTRITKQEGLIIIGVPNLAALHCRIQLLLGRQPSCIHIDDAHVRGFTASELIQVIQRIEGLKLLEFQGSNLYGVPPGLAKRLSRRFPTLAVCLFFLIQKTQEKVNVIHLIKEKKLETNYFVG